MHTAPAISGTFAVSGKPAFAASCQIAKLIPAITGNRMHPTKMQRPPSHALIESQSPCQIEPKAVKALPLPRSVASDYAERMTQSEALEIFAETGALMEGHFILRSGLHSRQFFQCAQALQQMPVVERLGAALAERIADTKPATILAPAMGGLVIGQEVAVNWGLFLWKARWCAVYVVGSRLPKAKSW